MKQNNQASGGGGIGFLWALAILFITFKLLDLIDWSWWLVLAPLWIPVVLVHVMAFIVAIWEK
jgi:hypothetical protein